MVRRWSRPERGRRLRAILIVAAVLLVLSVSTIVSFYTDLLWFRELKIDDVFWQVLSTKGALVAAFGSAFFVFALANLLIVRRLMPSYVRDPNDVLDRYRASYLPFLRPIAIGASAFLAFVFAVGAAPAWQRFLLAANAVDFGKVDPQFGRDIGFYVFQLPVAGYAYRWLFSALIIVTLLVAGGHYLTGGIRPQAAAGRFSPAVKAHLSVLLGLIALARAWGYRLDQYTLLYSTRGDVTGASYTDINAELPALKLLVIVSIIGAVLFLVNIRSRGWALPIVGLGLWLLVSIVAKGAFPFIVQRFTVEPDQQQKERPFIQRNIDATREAYGLGGVKTREHPITSDVNAQIVAQNKPTVDNIRLFDPGLLRKVYSQVESLRRYYEFTDVDVDRYEVSGQKRQVMLSARELELGSLEGLSWVNSHLFYTHGYGAVASPTNEVEGAGRPRFLVKDIPPDASVPELEIKQGGIYFGEYHSDYSVVATGQRELDYGQEEGNRYTKYSGKGGVPIDSVVDRLAFAWRFRNVNLLISGLINKDSKIIFDRTIQQRMQKAAPFLGFDGDPYPVITGGRIVWMADAYTSTDMYPYSERVDFAERTMHEGAPSLEGRNNYIRNSVKVTVDAYDGTMKLYVWDEKDPIIRAWQGAFPSLFTPKDQMPEDLREHVRYPEDIFRIQSHIYRLYHVNDPVDFFAREDQWEIPHDPNKAEGAVRAQQDEVQPYYVLMRLPGAAEEQYVLILPMNPRGRRNMVAYLAVSSEPEDYGTITDFRFPKTKSIFGVEQIYTRINQDPGFSRDKSLLDTGGSRLPFGNLLVIPIGESLMYVQPVFLEADRNAQPEMKFVAIATQERVVVGKSLQEALQLLVQGGGTVVTTPIDSEGDTDVERLVEQALNHLKAADEAARRGDWATYGREQTAAREALEKANARSGASPAPSPVGTSGG